MQGLRIGTFIMWSFDISQGEHLAKMGLTYWTNFITSGCWVVFPFFVCQGKILSHKYANNPIANNVVEMKVDL